jgi:Na+-driven multidrug efflux pump
LYTIATGIFSALGDSKTPFIFLVCSSTANIFMDILFVTTFDMEVAGVAWATFICQGISCIFAMMFVFKRLATIKAEAAPPLFSWALLKDISIVAIPSILQQSFISVGNIIVQGTINGFGPSVIAGYSASVKLNNLVITSLTTLGNGISNFTAQNLGAKKPERIKEGFRAGVKLVWIICIPFVLLYLFAGKYLVYAFLNTPTEAALSTGITFLSIVSPFYFFASLKLVADGILRGAGMMKKFMIATFANLVLRVVFAMALSIPFGSTGIWIAWPIGWVIATVMSIIFYKSGCWNKA